MQKEPNSGQGSTFGQLFGDQVHKQYEHTVFGTAATLINAVIMALILKSHVGYLRLSVWLGCAVIVSACRLVLHRCYKQSTTQYAQPEKWNVWFMVTLFLSGLLWGAVAIFLFPAASIGHQAFIAFVTGGMVAGAASAFTSVMAAYFIFSIPALIPVIVRFFLMGSQMHVAMGIMVLLFLLIVSLTAGRMHHNILHLLMMKYEKGALIADLQREVEQRKEAQEELGRQKEQVEELVLQRTAQLKKASQRLRAILNYAPLVIWAVDQKGMITFCDGKGMETIGFDPGKSVGHSLFELYDKGSPMVAVTRRVLAGEFISETVGVEDAFFEVRYQPIINADDHWSGAIGVAIDVTEQTSAKEALRKSDEKYRDLVENINDVLFAVDRDGMITFISPVIESVLGYRVAEVTGRCFFDYIHDQDQARLREDFNRASDMIGRPREYRFVGQSGKMKWCRVNSRPISESGEKTGVQGVLVDIDHSKRLEAQLQRAQKMEALGILAGGVAHDLNNILSGIVSYPELLLMDLDKDSRLRRPLDTIKKAGENAATIVQDLLTLACQGLPTKELLNLNHLVEHCLDSPEIVALMHHHPNVKIATRLESDLLNIYGSSTQISKSVANLIINAVEAMPQGGRIGISTGNRYADRMVSGFDDVEEGEYVVLSIVDSGIGIAEENQARIFEPFYTRKVMGRGGSGLGMAVVWGTVKDHKGFIDLKSEEERGTRFELFFPATRDQLKTIAAPGDISDLTGHGEFILVIDDMPAQREIACSILQRLGYRSKSVDSGEAALEYLRHNRVDLLILDMIMDPGMDGYETYRQIVGIRPGQKAIIASGYSENEKVLNTQNLGSVRYIKKPYTLSAIGQLIKALLQD